MNSFNEMEQVIIRMIKRGHLFLRPLNDDAQAALNRLIQTGAVNYCRKSEQFSLSASFVRTMGDGV